MLPAGVRADSPPTISIQPTATVTAGAADTSVGLSVSLSAPVADADVTVDYAATDGTAKQGTDYVLEAGTLTIPANQPSGTITVAIKAGSAGGDFTVTLSNPSGNAALGDPITATVTINPAPPPPPPPTVSVPETATYTAADADTTVNLPVTLSGTTAADVTVDYKAADGTAKQGTDYVLADGQAKVTAGTTTVGVPITIKSGTAGGTFTVTLSNQSGNATLGNAVTIVTVNPAPTRIDIGPRIVTAQSTDLRIDFRVTLSKPVGAPVTVGYHAVDGTAHNDVDYVLAPGTVTIPAGDDHATFPIVVKPGTAGGTFTVALSDPSSNAVIGNGTAVVTINPASGTPTTPTLTISDQVFTAGAVDTEVAVHVGLSPAADADVTVDYAVADGTAHNGPDYVLAPGTLTVPAGETGADLTLTIKAGTPGGTFTITLSNPVGNAVLGDGQATVTVNPISSGPTLTIADVSVREDAAAAKATLTVTLAGTPTVPVSVDYATSDGTATAGSDYTAAQGTLTFATGETTKTIDVPIKDDALKEANETFLVTLSKATGATIARTQAKVTIVDDETERSVGGVGSGGVDFGTQQVGGGQHGTGGSTGGGQAGGGSGSNPSSPAGSEPAGQSGASAGASAKKGVAVRITPLTLRLTAGKQIRVRLACPAGATPACVGTLTVRSATGSRTMGHAKVNLKAGRTAVFGVRIAPFAQALLARAGTLKATLVVSVKEGARTALSTRKVVLRSGKPPRASVTLVVP